MAKIKNNSNENIASGDFYLLKPIQMMIVFLYKIGWASIWFIIFAENFQVTCKCDHQGNF